MRFALALVIAGLLLPAAVEAEELSARQIAKRALERNALGLSGAEVKLTMTLVNKRKSRRERRLQIWVEEQEGRTRSLARFLAPPEVAGTGFLSIEEADGVTRQALYLPSLKRVRRVSGKRRGDRFMGSDFSYSDLQFRDVSDYRLERQADASVGKIPVYVVDASPSEKSDSPYGRMRLYVHKERMVALRIDFFDRKDKAVKELRVKRLKKVDGRWVAMESTMKDLARKHRTELTIDSIQMREDIPDDLFTERNLERG